MAAAEAAAIKAASVESSVNSEERAAAVNEEKEAFLNAAKAMQHEVEE
jgi:hypothetical protein